MSRWLDNDRSAPINIIADYREARSGVLEALNQIEDARVIAGKLPAGDYQIDNKLLVERKTLLDLVASIKEGRLFQQACRLASASLRPVLLLEGTASDIRASKMRREAIQGALITITLILDIPILRSLHPEESARLMIYAARQIRTIATGGLPRHGRRPKRKRATQLYILQGLPGVGPDRARRLLEAFGTVEAVLSASFTELLTVSGVGKVTARAIRWAVSDIRPAYRFKNKR